MLYDNAAMSQTITVTMGEVAVGHNNTRIKTSSIGSCVVIVLYDDEAGVGGLAHAMLPTRSRNSSTRDSEPGEAFRDESRAKYADESVDCLVREIEKIGGRQKRFKARLIGGARMFKILSGDQFGIGYQNVESARARLTALGIPIESEETGGTVGRLAEFDLETGLVEVITKM